MNPMRKVSAAVLIAAISVLPASGVFAASPVKITPSARAMAVTAAKAPAKVVAPTHLVAQPVAAKTPVANASAAKTDVVPAATLKTIIGKWTKADLALLGKSKSVQVLDTKAIYTPADLKIIQDARAADAAGLGKFHAALNADSRLKARFAKNKIDVNSVIGLSVNKTGAKIYLG